VPEDEQSSMRRGSHRGVRGLPGILPFGPRRTLPAAFLLLLTTGCSDTVYVYKMYGGPVRPDAELAVVDLGEAMAVIVGPRKVDRSDYGQLSLLPGTYPMRWGCVYGVSVLVEPGGWAAAEASGEVLLEAGHRYTMHCDRTTGPGYETYQWLTDDTTGAVVTGTRKP
jgi:hypothetical protein